MPPNLKVLSFSTRRFGSLGYFAPAALALLAVGFMVVRSDFDERQRIDESERAAVSQTLDRIAASLQSNINGNVMLASGLVAAVESDPNLDQAKFARLAEDTLAGKSQIRNIAAAPDLVVRLIYPEEPNRKSLGLDYRKNPRQWEAVLEVSRASRPIVTGPVDLVQGGSGLIARYPVIGRRLNGERFFWGILSAVMDLEKLYTESGLLGSDGSLQVAISRRAKDGSLANFFGNPELFGQNPVLSKVELGYDSWVLAAVPKRGWAAVRPGLTASRFFSLTIAIAVAGPFLWIGNLLKQRQQNILVLREREGELETLSHRLQLALEASKIGVWEYDASTRELNWDKRMRAIYSVPETKPQCEYEDWRRALHPEDLADAEATFAKALAEGTNYQTRFRIVTPSGDVRTINAFGLPYTSMAGTLRLVGANADVTEDVKLEEDLKAAHARAEMQNRSLEEIRLELDHQSIHDALTGLPNRRYLDRYLETPPNDIPHVVAHLDLDHFKDINDTLGHATGDEVLREAGRRISNALLESEFVARIGGDEFVVVAPATAPEERGRILAEALHAAFKASMTVNGFECQVGSSIGLAAQQAPGPDVRQLLANADFALYRAKQLGRNRFRFFDQSMRVSAASLKKTTDEFLGAISRVEFVPFFQPQFDAVTHEIVGVEALARWDHPERGLLTPDKFLPLAESLNKVHEIDEIILEKSLFQRARWMSCCRRAPKLSVNISAQRLRDERLAKRLSNLHIASGSLAFELLESISFDGRDEDVLGTISKLKQLGVEIEIDDFGSGHASITSLLEISPERLKIDRKIVLPIVHSVPHQRLVAAIVEIGKSFGIEITAEGVETMEHARILKDIGCQTLQGYAFAKPMSSGEFLSFLQNLRNEAKEPQVCA